MLDTVRDQASDLKTAGVKVSRSSFYAAGGKGNVAVAEVAKTFGTPVF